MNATNITNGYEIEILAEPTIGRFAIFATNYQNEHYVTLARGLTEEQARNEYARLITAQGVSQSLGL